jgi:hypothetical protein
VAIGEIASQEFKISLATPAPRTLMQIEQPHVACGLSLSEITLKLGSDIFCISKLIQ